MKPLSLRLRLFLSILLPLVITALILGWWRFSVADKKADELFDRALLAAALAISKDIAISQGDALLPTTNALIQNSAGGQVFYHATGPGGYYVTGYAYPPISNAMLKNTSEGPQYYKATYRDDPVRVLRLTERITVDSITGDSTISVWQRANDRKSLSTQLAKESAIIAAAMLATVLLAAWLAVQWGLRPLTNLQEAVAMRSADDLRTIKRRVPQETQGLVDTINRLLGQVENSMAAHQNFISDASHQLRNRAAAVQSMAESIQHASNEQAHDTRVSELIEAARDNTRVTTQLLSLDRLQHQPDPQNLQTFDVNHLTADVCTDIATNFLNRGVSFEYVPTIHRLPISADKTFVAEALKNLIDNALQHGGADLSTVVVSTCKNAGHALITVYDNGADLTPADTEKAFGRFSQIEPGVGSGLGLSIADSVAQRHGGALVIGTVDKGAQLTLSFPLTDFSEPRR